MNKIKEFFEVKRNIAISSITLLVIVAIASVAVFMITKKPTKNEVVTTVTQSSEPTSSETASSVPTVKVLDIVATSSTASVSSKETLELKVDGNPSSKVAESKPVEKQKATSSKPTSKPAVPKPNKPTPPTTATSPADGDFKTDGDTLFQFWDVDGQWHDVGPADGGGKTLEEQRADNDEFIKNYHCDKCGGDFYTCKCTTGNMG